MSANMLSPKHWAIKAINHYQKNGGGLQYFGVRCNYSPTCSQYTKEAIQDVGLWRGVGIGWARIRRCTQPGLSNPISDPYLSSTMQSDHTADGCAQEHSHHV